jgi:D-alanyl-D-alanine carboxypeptidase
MAAAVIALFAVSACSATAARPPRRPVPSSPPTSTPTAAPSAAPTAAPSPRAVPTASPTPTVLGFDKTAQSIDDPNSTWVVVNKVRPLHPIDFTPDALVHPDVTYVNRQPMRPEVAQALAAMFHAGKAEAGLGFSVQSAYRPFDSQTRVYDDDVARHGRAYADADTARPGFSEHQTGLAVDISAVPARCSLDACFARTPEGVWLAAQSWRFGFILRYPSTKVAVTGFTFEPWHFRYVGIPLATQLHATNTTTLEEFFGVPGGTEYR